jgi:hypothetical protein
MQILETVAMAPAWMPHTKLWELALEGHCSGFDVIVLSDLTPLPPCRTTDNFSYPIFVFTNAGMMVS